MLSISIVNVRGGRYYVDLARAGYSVGGGESPGEWHANAAPAAFGLHDTVEKQDIERLFDEYHPETGRALAQNHGNPD